ncbi:hypothetical protein B9G55_12280 [Saccharibacillus sp. O16]|nr:hypothetical protein B9G55_12280 [Saccharibacillus sp. O16]
MFTNQIRMESRRHLPFFLTLAVIQLACGLFFSLNGNSDLAFASLLINMVIGILVPIYIFMDCYKEFYVGSTVLNHMVPMSTFSLFVCKSVVFLIGCLMVWAAGLLDVLVNPTGFYSLRMQASDSIEAGLFYLFASKFAGVLCGLSIIGLSLSASKQFHRRVPSMFTMTVVVLVVIGALAVPIASQTEHWSLGTSSLQAFKQYAGFLSITNVYEGTVANVNDTIQWSSVFSNLIAMIFSMLGCLLLFGSRRYEIYGK